MQKDPMCGMEVDEDKAVRAKKQGKTFYFCSRHCKDKFLSMNKEPGGNMRHDNMHGHHSKSVPNMHHPHHAHMVADFRRRFWVSIVLTIPILALSPMIQKFLGIGQMIRFKGHMYLLFVLSSVVFFWGGEPFLKGIYEELKKRRPGMMTLIARMPTSSSKFLNGSSR